MQLAQTKILPDSFQQILPGIGAWVDSMATDPLAVSLQSWFAQIEVIHFLGLFALAACVILTSLRLIGVGIVEASPSDFYRNTSIWLHLGVIAAVGSGLFLGLSNASKLYNSSAFLWKMTAMVAAILFSYLVMAPVAKAEGEVRGGAKIGLLIALAVWLLGIVIMIVKPIANVGAFHVIYAGALVAIAALQGRSRWILIGGLTVMIVALQVATYLIWTDPFTEVYMLVNKIFMWGAGLFVAAVVAWNILGRNAAPGSNPLARLVGYASILSWVMVGAGGRWIGLS